MLKSALTPSSTRGLRLTPRRPFAAARRARNRRRIGQAQRCVAPHPQISARAPTIRDSEVTGTAGSKSRSVSLAIEESKSPAIAIRRRSGPASLQLRDFALQARFARDVAFDVRAALARQRVRVVLQPGDAFGGRQGTARRLRVERGDDPPEFVERAAEPLAILLREFRPLRAEETAQEADRQRQSSRQHRKAPLSRAQAIARLAKSHTPH